MAAEAAPKDPGSGPEPTDNVDYRDRAKAHLDAAKSLLASGTRSELIYACLELRLAIEALAYETVQLLRSDLSEEVLRTWQADKLLREFKEMDPGLDGTLTIEISPADGAEGPTFTFVEHRLTSAWTGKAYPTLGSFLHERTLLQLDRGHDPDDDLVRSKADAIVAELERVLGSNGWNLRATHNYVFQCDCGSTFKGRLGLTQLKGRARCVSCESLYEIEPVADDRTRQSARATLLKSGRPHGKTARKLSGGRGRESRG